MTQRSIIIEWDDEEVYSFQIALMTAPSGQGMQWTVNMRRQYNVRNVHGQSIGDVWASNTEPDKPDYLGFENAWEGALGSMRLRTQQRLESQNSRPKPEAPKLTSETITTNKSLDDLGL